MDEVGRSEYDRVMDFVMAEVLKRPKANNEELRRLAATISPSVMELGIRQFQGKYRLPAIRRLRKAGRLPPAPPRPVTNGRRRRGRPSAAAAEPAAPTPAATPAPAPVAPPAARPSPNTRGGAAAPRVVRPAAPAEKPRSPADFNRDAARTELMKFAMAVAAAEDQQTTLAAVAKIDEYVDRIGKASR